MTHLRINEISLVPDDPDSYVDIAYNRRFPDWEHKAGTRDSLYLPSQLSLLSVACIGLELVHDYAVTEVT